MHGRAIDGKDNDLKIDHFKIRLRLEEFVQQVIANLGVGDLPRIPYQGSTDERQKWEFVASVKGEYEPGTMSNSGYAGRLTETILVGNLALRAGEGQRILWDANELKSTNVEAVNEFVGREAREGWEIEQPVA